MYKKHVYNSPDSARNVRARLTPRTVTTTSTNRSVRSVLRSLQRARLASRLSSRTASAVKTIQKKKQGVIRNDGPISKSYANFPIRNRRTYVPRGLYHATLPNKNVTNGFFRLSATVGGQNYNCDVGMLDRTDLLMLFAKAKIIGNVLGAGTEVDVQNVRTQKITVENVRGEFMISNAQNDPCRVTIYDCCARRDMGSNGFSNPVQAWTNGVADANNAAISAIVGSTPFQAPAFPLYWIVEKTTTVELHTGGHHCHYINYSPHVTINQELLMNDSIDPLVTLAKTTRFIMIVIHGFPVNDQTVTATVSTNSCSVDVVYKREIDYRVWERSTTNISYTNNLSDSITPRLINDLTGLSTANVVA